VKITDEQIASEREKLRALSVLLDEAFTLPIVNVRVGWDSIIGLIPVIGDIAGALISCYFLWKAIQFKTPLLTVSRMIVNIGVELVVGMIPVFGDMFDVAWKSNRRNCRLIEQHLDKLDASKE